MLPIVMQKTCFIYYFFVEEKKLYKNDT